MVAITVATWAARAVIQAGKDIVKLRGKIEGVNIKIDAEAKSADQRFEDVKGWLEGISEKIDTMNQFLLTCPRRAGRPCSESKALNSGP